MWAVHGARCGEAFKKICTSTKTQYTQKKLEKGAYYKYFVVAVENGSVIATSKTVHIATKGKKVGNDKTVKLSKTKINLKAGKTVKIKASAKPWASSQIVKRHRKISYESSDPGVASVSSSGVVKAIKKGNCTIYAYAQDGVSAKLKISVK